MIIDYGLGNLASIANALEKLGISYQISAKVETIKKAAGLILPGVGAAGQGMSNLKSKGLDKAIYDQVKKGKPIFGICLGMQLLLSFSEEGNVDCLGLVEGKVKRLRTTLKVPEIGWNEVEVQSFPTRGILATKLKVKNLFKDIPDNSFFYFVNSYYCEPEDNGIIVGTTNYDGEFCSFFMKGNIVGAQFHPEKSWNAGLQLLKNFYEMSLGERTMTIIPAIDIKNGKCVRLTQGKFDRETIYDDDPVRVAKQWEKEGAKMLHIVDLDGAKNGTQSNFAVIQKIASEISIPLQVGGGIRNKKTVKKLLSLGISRVVLGTVALENEDELKAIVKDYAQQIVIALETKGGKLVIKGWVEKSDKQIMETALKLQKLGVQRFLYTDVARDGTLTEPNYRVIEQLKKNINIPFIASGGVSTIDSVKKLKEIAVEEVIIGKALYEKKFTLQEVQNVN